MNNLAQKVYERMRKLGCKFRAINIVYLEDADRDGNPLPERRNAFNDRSLLLKVVDGREPEIIFNAIATTEPGEWYTQYPMNLGGAFNIQLDKQFHDCWRFGVHGTGKYAHPSLVQCKEITGYRDGNKDSIRSGDRMVTGNFGVNQHSIYSYSQTENDIGKSSAGCLVRLNYADHMKFMSILKENHGKGTTFDTIVLDASKL